MSSRVDGEEAVCDGANGVQGLGQRALGVCECRSDTWIRIATEFGECQAESE